MRSAAPPRRRLRTRLALLYTGLVFIAGVVVLVIVDIPLLTGQHSSPGPTGPGADPASGAVSSVSETNLAHVLAYSAIALVAVLMLSVGLGWLIADRALRPLRTLTAAARDTSVSNLSNRPNVTESYQEFTELQETLGDLFTRLEASFRSQRHFVANASHELRTPLAAERTLLQVALSDPDATADTLRLACEELLALGRQQERLLDALLTLAGSQRGVDRWESFDLAELTRTVVRARRAEAERRSVDIGVTLRPAWTTGDPSLAASLVANLVDNALRHNTENGSVTITTATNATAATLTVTNTGAVVPAGEVDRLLQPFQRLGAERTRHTGGHGLGLAIVDAVAAAHAATLSVCARPQGGLAVAVRFPTRHDP